MLKETVYEVIKRMPLLVRGDIIELDHATGNFRLKRGPMENIIFTSVIVSGAEPDTIDCFAKIVNIMLGKTLVARYVNGIEIMKVK